MKTEDTLMLNGLYFDTCHCEWRHFDKASCEVLTRAAEEAAAIGGIVTICYYEAEVWRDRNEAIASFLEGMRNSEGPENARYEEVMFQLVDGHCIAHDGVSDRITEIRRR